MVKSFPALIRDRATRRLTASFTTMPHRRIEPLGSSEDLAAAQEPAACQQLELDTCEQRAGPFRVDQELGPDETVVAARTAGFEQQTDRTWIVATNQTSSTAQWRALRQHGSNSG